MKQCPIIEDLLPLYVDDAVSDDSRQLVEEHLSTCTECREALRALRVGTPALPDLLPPGAAPSDDARFLSRLKRWLGNAAGLLLILLALTAYYASQYGQIRADRAQGRLMETQRVQERAALEAMRQASPDPMARLREHGVNLKQSASLLDGSLQVAYELRAESPAVHVSSLQSILGSTMRLYDPSTGKEIGRMREARGSTGHDGVSVGNIIFEGVPTLPAGARIQLPDLGLYTQPDRPLQWALQRPQEESSTSVGERFTVAGVEFEVERVRFTKQRVSVDYRQLTDSAKVGLYFLSFRVSDYMGGQWGGDYPLDPLPDPLRPSQTFDLVTSLSKRWSVRVESAVLTLPGPSIPVEVK